jgi:hypothetical protein
MFNFLKKLILKINFFFFRNLEKEKKINFPNYFNSINVINKIKKKKR